MSSRNQKASLSELEMAPRLEFRTERRRAATEREKRRMERFNDHVDEIKMLVCPRMKSATKAKVLREAVNRLIFLEDLAVKLNALQESNYDVVNVTSENEKPMVETISTEQWYQDEEKQEQQQQQQQIDVKQHNAAEQHLDQLLENESFDYGLDGFGFELKGETTDDFFKELQAHIEPFMID